MAGTELTGVQQLDGKSILPILMGEGELGREKLFWHFPAYLESYSNLKEVSRDTLFRTRPVSVIRKGDWKLLMFHEEWSLDGGRDKITENNAIELYNLKEDLGEQNNLSNQKTDIRDELLGDLLQWIDEVEAPIPAQANPEYDSRYLKAAN